MARDTPSNRTSGLKVLFSWTVSLTLLSATTFMLALWNLPALNDWRTARNRMEATQNRVDRERAVIVKLEKERDAIAVDRRALERAAREEYLLLRPGEEVYVFQERRSTR